VAYKGARSPGVAVFRICISERRTPSFSSASRQSCVNALSSIARSGSTLRPTSVLTKFHRQLKKLINQIVRELSSLGLSPALLQELLERSKNEAQVIEAENKVYSDEPILMDPSKSHSLPKIVYGVDAASGRIEPRLRLWVDSPIFPPNLNISMASPSGSISSDFQSDPADMLAFGGRNISMLQAPQKGPWIIAADAGERKFAPEPSCVHCIEVPTTE